MSHKNQRFLIKKEQKIFLNRLDKMVKLKQTENANFDCELCKRPTLVVAMSVFMYPDYSHKALCYSCARSELISLDYSNKN